MAADSKVGRTKVIFALALAAFAVFFTMTVQVPPADAARKCKTVIHKRNTVTVNANRVSCKVARKVLRRYVIRTIRGVKPNRNGIHRIRGFRCFRAHGNEVLCSRGKKTAYGILAIR